MIGGAIPADHKETNMNIKNCGISVHRNDCLCDVVIPRTTGWVNDAVQDMWMGLEIVEMREYGRPWTDGEIVAYLKDLVYAKDNWAKHKRIESRRTVGTLAYIRDEVRKRLHESECSVFDVMNDLGITYEKLISALFTSRRYMTPEQLKMFEDDVRSGTFSSPSTLGSKYGMPYKSARSLWSYWGTPFRGKDDNIPLIREFRDSLILDVAQLSNTEIADRIEERFGPTYRPSLQSISQRRKRLKNCKRP